MFINNKSLVGLGDITPRKEMKNTALLRILENAAGIHSEIAGYGITDMNKTRRSWVIINWKIEVLSRPLINDKLNVKTWIRMVDKYHSFRDFQVTNQYNDIVAIGTTKWIFIDIDKEKLTQIPQEVSNQYQPELGFSIFKCKDESEEIDKLREPENLEVLNESKVKITRSMIDINKHLHNVFYLDIAKETFPEEIAFANEFNNFEIMYKKEIKYGETVTGNYYYDEENKYHIVVIKDEENKNLHAILRFK